MLKIRQDIPEGLLELEAHELHKMLEGPTLFHLPGRRTPALFISVLLHGNEPVGWNAIRSLLYHHQNRELPREISLFIGNVHAAKHHQRHLDNQLDFNRIWATGDAPEHLMAKQVCHEMKQAGLFASIDVHNNTGINPHYACVNKLDVTFLHLATLFSRTVIYFTRPEGVQSLAFSKFTTAVTLECGQPDNQQGAAHAVEYLTACLNMAEIPSNPIAKHDIELFHTVATVHIAPSIEIGFKEDGLDLCLVDDIDHLNFRELPIDTLIGWQPINRDIVLRATNEQDQDVSNIFFRLDGAALRVRRPVMPAMLTRDTKIIRQDCLCYLMERLPLPNQMNNNK